MYFKLIKNIIPFVISIPLFYIIGGDFNITLIGQEDQLFGVVFPISLVLLCLMIPICINNKKILLLLFAVFIHFGIIYGMALNYLHLNVWLYFLAYLTFRSLFLFETKERSSKIIIISIVTLYVVQFSLLIGDTILELEFKSLLTNTFKVYNYEQYFSISMALGLAIFVGISENKYNILNFALVAFMGAIHSGNSSAIVIIITILFCHYFVDIKKFEKIPRAMIFLFLIIFPVLTPFVLQIIFILLNIHQDEVELILNGRGAIWAEYYKLITIENLFYNDSFAKEVDSRSLPSVHNIFLYYIFTLNPFIGSIFYLLLIMSINKIHDLQIRFYVLLVICLAGTNLELITHPYFAIQLAFFTTLLRTNNYQRYFSK